MSGSHYSLVPLSSSNFSTYYTPVYLCPSSTFSTQSHLLANGIESLIPYSLFNPLDFCHGIACIALMPCTSTISYVQKKKQEKEMRLRPTYYSHGMNLGPSSGRNHSSHKYIKQHNDYNYSHLTIITNNLWRVEPRLHWVQIE